ncbi:MAG: DUF2291 family protein, partial [Paracoccus sp. (in: a-proteobacteria)]
MTVSDPAPKAPASSRRGLYLSLIVGVAVLGAIALDTTVVRVGSESDLRQQAFSPDAYGAEAFPRIRDVVTERAVPATDLAAAIAADQDAAIAEYGTPASTGAIMMTTLTGTAGEPRAGVYPLEVEGLPDDLTVRVQTGPAINGTDLRDAPGDIAFGDFTNQIEYQDAGVLVFHLISTSQLDRLVLEPLVLMKDDAGWAIAPGITTHGNYAGLAVKMRD